MRLIGPDGDQLGIMKIDEARNIAYDAGLDLVEIAPDAKPPVCKIMDFGKYKFETEKREKEQRRRRQTIELKEIQLKLRIDIHDFNTKLGHALRFLGDGNKVKVVVRFRGREMTHSGQGVELMKKFAEGVGEAGVIEKHPRQEGYSMTMIVAPAKAVNSAKGN